MNFLHFGAIQVTIGSLVLENIRPVCYLALCDRRQVKYNHACQISSLSRMTKNSVCFLYYPNLTVATRDKSCLEVKYGSLNCWGVFSSLYGMNMFGPFKYASVQIQVLYSLTNTNNPAILDNLPYARTLNGEVQLQKGHVNTIDIPAGWKLDWMKNVKPRLLDATKPVHSIF